MSRGRVLTAEQKRVAERKMVVGLGIAFARYQYFHSKSEKILVDGHDSVDPGAYLWSVITRSGALFNGSKIDLDTKSFKKEVCGDEVDYGVVKDYITAYLKPHLLQFFEKSIVKGVEITESNRTKGNGAAAAAASAPEATASPKENWRLLNRAKNFIKRPLRARVAVEELPVFAADQMAARDSDDPDLRDGAVADDGTPPQEAPAAAAPEVPAENTVHANVQSAMTSIMQEERIVAGSIDATVKIGNKTLSFEEGCKSKEEGVYIFQFLVTEGEGVNKKIFAKYNSAEKNFSITANNEDDNLFSKKTPGFRESGTEFRKDLNQELQNGDSGISQLIQGISQNIQAKKDGSFAEGAAPDEDDMFATTDFGAAGQDDYFGAAGQDTEDDAVAPVVEAAGDGPGQGDLAQAIQGDDLNTDSAVDQQSEAVAAPATSSPRGDLTVVSAALRPGDAVPQSGDGPAQVTDVDIPDPQVGGSDTPPAPGEGTAIVDDVAATNQQPEVSIDQAAGAADPYPGNHPQQPNPVDVALVNPAPGQANNVMRANGEVANTERKEFSMTRDLAKEVYDVLNQPKRSNRFGSYAVDGGILTSKKIKKEGLNDEKREMISSFEKFSDALIKYYNGDTVGDGDIKAAYEDLRNIISYSFGSSFMKLSPYDKIRDIDSHKGIATLGPEGRDSANFVAFIKKVQDVAKKYVEKSEIDIVIPDSYMVHDPSIMKYRPGSVAPPSVLPEELIRPRFAAPPPPATYPSDLVESPQLPPPATTGADGVDRRKLSQKVVDEIKDLGLVIQGQLIYLGLDIVRSYPGAVEENASLLGSIFAGNQFMMSFVQEVQEIDKISLCFDCDNTREEAEDFIGRVNLFNQDVFKHLKEERNFDIKNIKVKNLRGEVIPKLGGDDDTFINNINSAKYLITAICQDYKEKGVSHNVHQAMMRIGEVQEGISEFDHRDVTIGNRRLRPERIYRENDVPVFQFRVSEVGGASKPEDLNKRIFAKYNPGNRSFSIITSAENDNLFNSGVPEFEKSVKRFRVSLNQKLQEENSKLSKLIKGIAQEVLEEQEELERATSVVDPQPGVGPVQVVDVPGPQVGDAVLQPGVGDGQDGDAVMLDPQADGSDMPAGDISIDGDGSDSEGSVAPGPSVQGNDPSTGRMASAGEQLLDDPVGGESVGPRGNLLGRRFARRNRGVVGEAPDIVLNTIPDLEVDDGLSVGSSVDLGSISTEGDEASSSTGRVDVSPQVDPVAPSDPPSLPPSATNVDGVDRRPSSTSAVKESIGSRMLAAVSGIGKRRRAPASDTSSELLLNPAFPLVGDNSATPTSPTAVSVDPGLLPGAATPTDPVSPVVTNPVAPAAMSTGGEDASLVPPVAPSSVGGDSVAPTVVDTPVDPDSSVSSAVLPAVATSTSPTSASVAPDLLPAVAISTDLVAPDLLPGWTDSVSPVVTSPVGPAVASTGLTDSSVVSFPPSMPKLSTEIVESIKPVCQYIKQESVPVGPIEENIDKFDQVLKRNQGNPQPTSPYRGIGIEIDIHKKNGVRSIVGKKVFSPSNNRFKSGTDSVDSAEFEGALFTEVKIDGNFVKISDLLNESSGKQKIATAFHGEGLVEFKIEKDGVEKMISCDNSINKSAIYTPSSSKTIGVDGEKFKALSEMVDSVDLEEKECALNAINEVVKGVKVIPSSVPIPGPTSPLTSISRGPSVSYVGG